MTEKQYQGGTAPLVDDLGNGAHVPVVRLMGGHGLQFNRAYSNGGLTLTETATPVAGQPVYTRVILLTQAHTPASWSQIGRWTSSDGSLLPAGLVVLTESAFIL